MKSTTGVWPPPLSTQPLVRPSEGGSLGDRAVRVSPDLLAPFYDQLKADQSADLALNIHLPFCPSRCLSCDRVAVVQHGDEEVDRYIVHLEQELMMIAAAVGGHRPLARVHFGGGSPNHLSDLTLATLFSHISRHFSLSSTTRISMELNPRRTSRAQLNFLKGLGVSQLKLEVRDVDAKVQQEIGRIHSLELLEDVISIAHGVRFESLGMDYLVGLPGQTVESCEQSMEAMVSLAPDWLVCLPFHRRESVFPHQIAVDAAHLPSLADRLAMFNQVQMGFDDAGYHWVGLNVFAKPEHELSVAQRTGNLGLNVLGYVPEKALAVLGVGLGALSEVPGALYQNEVNLSNWHALIDAGLLSAHAAVVPDESETLRRKVLRGLVCQQTLHATSLTPAQENEWLLPLVDQGFAKREEQGEYLLTELGRSVLPHVWSDSSPAFRSL
ncbi:MAG: radical SAM protein [Luminiphilus sp.]